MNIMELMARSAELMPLAKDAVKAVDELIAAADKVANWKDGISDRPGDFNELRRATDKVIELRAKLPKDI
jgi:hypothetical protein